MIRFRSLALLLALALTFAACESPLDPLPEPDLEVPRPDLLPLDVGTQWVLAYRDTSHVVDRIQEGVDTLRVVDAYSLDGEMWGIVESSGQSSLRHLFDGHYTNREDGVWKWRPGLDGQESEPYLLYKAATETGEVYTLPFDKLNSTVTVTDVNLSVQTGAGVLESIRYTFDADRGWGLPIAPGAARFDRMLAPGTGFVYIEAGTLSTMGNDHLVRANTVAWRLVSFSP